MEKGKDRGINISQHTKMAKQVCDFLAEWEAQLHWLNGPLSPKTERLDVGCRVMPGLCRQWASREPHFVCFHFSKMG